MVEWASRGSFENIGDAQLIGLLTVDPDLGRGLDPSTLPDARRLVLGIRHRLPAGPWDPETAAEAGLQPSFAALIIEGLMTRECRLADAVSVEIHGPGDIIDPWSPPPGMMPNRIIWSALTDASIAVLDRHFLAAVRRWPTIALRLFERMAEQRVRASLHATINALSTVEQRILAMLWHLAGLYGRVGPDGVKLPMRLSHEAIGRLIGARRPTVSLAMKSLAERRLLQTQGREGFLLAADLHRLLDPDPEAGPVLTGAGLHVVGPVATPGRQPRIDLEGASGRSVARLREEVTLLRDADAALRALFALAGIGAARVLAADGRLLDVNDRLATVLGEPRQRLVETNLWDRIPDGDRDRCLGRLQPLLTGASDRVELSLRLRAASGAVVVTRANAALLTPPHIPPEEAELVVTLEDVTEAQAAEDERRMSDEVTCFRLALTDMLRAGRDSGEMQRRAAEMLERHLGASTRGVYFSRLAGAESPDADGAVVIPLARDGAPLLSLTVFSARGHVWSDAELELIEDTAERTWSFSERLRAEAELTARVSELEQYAPLRAG